MVLALKGLRIPRPPAAGFAKENRSSNSNKFGCCFHFFGGERGIRTPGTVNPYGSLANCWFQPLTHLTMSPFMAESVKTDCKYTIKLLFCNIFSHIGIGLDILHPVIIHHSEIAA